MEHTSKFVFLLPIVGLLLTSCYREDPGPQQSERKEFALVDFDRLEASEALDITIKQGNIFSVSATGDSRNINDLDIHTNGGTLIMRFDTQKNRQYTTYITITMPSLFGVSFSGAVNAKATGFAQENFRFDISLSGASVAQVEIEVDVIYAQLTGASQLRLTGTGHKIDAAVTGASLLSAFDFPVDEVQLVISGASHAKVRGNPVVDSEVTGASSISKD